MHFKARLVVVQAAVFFLLCCLLFVHLKWCESPAPVRLVHLSYAPQESLRYYPQTFRYCPHFKEYNFTICLYDPQYDQLISATLIRGDMWEKATVDHVRRWLLREPGLNLLDVGANIGVYSLAATGVAHKAVAVEPMPKSLDLLRMAIKQRRLHADDILLVPFAVSDGYYNLTLETSWSNPGRSVMQAEPCTRRPGHFCTRVQTIMLDDLFSLPAFSKTFRKSIMKIDIEGHEFPTLMAATRLWKELDIVVIIMEWEWVGIKWLKMPEKVHAFLDFMGSMDYIAKEPLYGGPLNSTEWLTWPTDVIWTRRNFYF